MMDKRFKKMEGLKQEIVQQDITYGFRETL